MPRMYNCKCGQQHPIGTECPNKHNYREQHRTEERKKANKFYNTKQWQLKREEIKTLDKGLCQRCLIKFNIMTYEQLEVHHIEPLLIKWEKRLQNNNLITLCRQCHNYIDKCNNGKLDFDWKRIEEDWNFEFR